MVKADINLLEQLILNHGPYTTPLKRERSEQVLVALDATAEEISLSPLRACAFTLRPVFEREVAWIPITDFLEGINRVGEPTRVLLQF